MTNLNNSQLDEQLRSMPQPDLNQRQRNEIKQAIADDRKPDNFKKYIAFASTAAACLIFFLLIMTTMNTNQQVAVSLSDVISDDIAMITGSDQATDYSSKEEEILDTFDKTIGSMTFTETDQATDTQYTQTLKLHNQEQEVIATIKSSGNDVVTLNGTHYQINGDKLNAFTDAFFTENFATDNETDEPDIREQGSMVLDHLLNKDMEALAEIVHPEKGLRFSPYVAVKESDITFSQEEIPTLLEQEEVYTWGTQAGSGHPIEMTPADYFKEYVNPQAYTEPDAVNINKQEQHGSMKNTINDIYPNAETVEFYHEGTEETELDWGSLTLVFEKTDDTQKLVAIVNDEWTS